jgi:dUTP pyrophosphatase
MMAELLLKIKKFRDNFKLPEKAKSSDAGFDCFISEFFVIDEKEKKMKPWREVMSKDVKGANGDEVALSPHQRVGCGLGFATEIPQGWYAQVVPRSGLALWQGLTITNTPGTIDEGFRNEWVAIVLNTSTSERKLKIGDKICQFMLKKSPEIKLEVVEQLSDSERGMGGFGSSDKKAK